MNGGDGMNGNGNDGNGRGNTNGRGKTLLPEFLPAPRSTEAQSPPDRVAERVRVLLQRFRGLGTAASAALLSLNCTNSGYMVVDPLPPPPVSCTSAPDPFAAISASAIATPGSATPPPAILMLETSQYSQGNFIGFSIPTVRVTGGTLVSVEDMSTVGQGGGTRFHLTISPASATATIVVEVDLTCSTQARTKYYTIAYRVPTSAGDLLVVTETAPVDAGTD